MGIREFVFSYFFTSEELRRLKQYVSDPYYDLYIRNRDKIVQAINAAFQALDLARTAKSIAETAYDLANQAMSRSKEALNLADYASSLAQRAKNLADAAWSRASDALSKANSALNLVDELQYRVNKLKQSVENAWNQINDITDKVNALKDFATDLVSRFDRARKRIEEIWATFKSRLEAHSNAIININNKIHKQILPSIKTSVEEFIKTLGWVQVDYSRLDGRTGFYEKGNRGEGIIADIADIFWCIGQCFYNMSHLIEKYHIGFEILSYKFGFDIWVPRPDRLATAVGWIWTLIEHPARRLFSKINTLQSKFNAIFVSIQELQIAINDIIRYTQLIVEDIANFAKEIANAIVEIVGGSVIPELSIPTSAKISAVSVSALASTSASKRHAFKTYLRKGIILTFTDDKGWLKQIREINLATKSTTRRISPRVQIVPY